MSNRPYIQDVWYLVSWSPYLWLSLAPRAEDFLRRHITYAKDCHASVAEYPKFIVEPLEFFYTCLRSLGALDISLIEALTRECGWRGTVWAAWLTILERRREVLPALNDVSGQWPNNDWIVQCAIAAVCGNPINFEHHTILESGGRCRQILNGVRWPMTRLRRQPTASQITQVNSERTLVRTAYGRGGSEAAHAAMKGTLLQYYNQSYPTWLARDRSDVDIA